MPPLADKKDGEGGETLGFTQVNHIKCFRKYKQSWCDPCMFDLPHVLGFTLLPTLLEAMLAAGPDHNSLPVISGSSIHCKREP